MHEITRSRVRWLKNALIGGFVQRFHPDMSDAEQPDPLAYRSFNDFFTRALRAGTRPVDPDPAALVSPVDGSDPSAVVAYSGGQRGPRIPIPPPSSRRSMAV